VLGHVKNLFRNLIIYLGDAATSVISLLLLPIFTQYLSPSEYGVIRLLLVVEAVTKVVFRWGVDTAFMRLYYDCRTQAARQQLASTIFFFLLAVNGTLVLISIAGSSWLAAWTIGTAAPAVLVPLTITNMFLAGFYFIPYQVLRIGERSTQYIALTFTRSAATIVARLLLVIWAGMGVLGIVLSDLIVTALFTLVMLRWFVPLIRPVFSMPVLRKALAFGLPRVPHTVAQQVMSGADSYFLKAYRTLAEVGLYSMGATFGQALRYFVSSFELAWTPFFLSVMHEPDARQIYRVISTYVVAILVLLVAGLAALAPDVMALFTTQAFHEGARVIPWIALAVMFQGLYIVGSIGLVITKRTTRYPIATGIACGVSLLANWLLVPRYGMLGAAYASVLAYATLAGVTSVFSWREYPIPYEWMRLLRIAAAGAISLVVTQQIGLGALPTAIRLIVHGLMVVAIYAATLYVTGFFHPGELKFVRDVRRRALRSGPKPKAPPPDRETEMGGDVVGTPPDISEADSRDRDR
jgi:O-antigen/teichoic acid export membrane protein